ncbi:cytochrome-c peroxidase [Formosa sp. A9]|uniref:cytochrome-c peroxidase n=1 Tax=Formosa sp. A9 TaxID=3442641 RepID=UPI003EBAD823
MNKNILVVKAKTYTFGICLLLLIVSCNNKSETVDIKKLASTNEQVEALYISELQECIKHLERISISNASKDNVAAYKQARLHFKQIEPILAAVDKNNFKSLNAPNILQVNEEDATDIKIRNPFGFQVIEELLHEPELDTLLLKNVVSVTRDRIKLLKANTRIQLKDYHLIWLIRDQIIRTATTGITGFDSPVLGQALKESQYTTSTLLKLIDIYKDNFTSDAVYNELTGALKNGISALDADFETFDRYDFIKNHTDVQLQALLKTQDDWRVSFPFEMAISNTAKSLFDKQTLNVFYFSDYKSDTLNLKQKEVFGKQLFNDSLLSKSQTMACATCHIKDKAFTDGRTVFNNKQIRNTPTLSYSGYQQSFFMDGRAGSLEGQVVGVAENHDEFNLPMDSIVDRVLKHPNYKQQLETLYKGKRADYNIRHAIASYIRTLNDFDSKFDNNINGKAQTITADEKQGFNLFMGKAACATCHFPPLFNGTVPPNYNDTEVELLGVPQVPDTVNAVISGDLGRYDVFQTEERKHFFKTPTVRNIAKTAPYMHNGVYESLEAVVDFYNRGGGKGIGIHEDYQTLPFDNLDLTPKEQMQLVAFMNSLTDAGFEEE